jgi:CRISPR-associated endonuclease/helicase Cas3
VFNWLAARAHAALEAARASKESEWLALDENSPALIVLDRNGTIESSLRLGGLAKLGDLSSYDKKKAFADISGRTLIISALLGGLNADGMFDERESKAPDVLDSGWTEEILLERIGYRVAGPSDGEPDQDLWKVETTILLAPPEANEGGEGKALRVFVRRAPAAAREGDLAVARRRQELKEHLDWVAEAAGEIAAGLKLPERYRNVLVFAARHHDHGKNRALWQDAMGAPRHGRPYAKTTGRGDGRRLNGYRHEFGSLGDVEANDVLADLDEDMRDLALHLIAAHHGYARPVITPFDPAAESPAERVERARQVALRFAHLQRRWGSWGLAWWEALLRAADWYASKRHDQRSDEKKEDAA